jgi:hypothetical protein
MLFDLLLRHRRKYISCFFLWMASCLLLVCCLWIGHLGVPQDYSFFASFAVAAVVVVGGGGGTHR